MLMILRRLRWRQCIRSTGFVEWISFLSICCHLLILFAWIIFFHFDWEMFFRFVLERCLSMREDINRVLFGYYQCLFVLCVFFSDSWKWKSIRNMRRVWMKESCEWYIHQMIRYLWVYRFLWVSLVNVIVRQWLCNKQKKEPKQTNINQNRIITNKHHQTRCKHLATFSYIYANFGCLNWNPTWENALQFINCIFMTNGTVYPEWFTTVFHCKSLSNATNSLPLFVDLQ